MKRSVSQGVILLTTAAIAVVLTGCPESKVSQCNKIMEVTQKAEAASKKFADDAEKTTPEQGSQLFSDIATQLSGFTKDIETLQISDEKLKGYQAEFAKMYKAASDDLNDGAKAMDNKDKQALDAALTSLQEDFSGEDQLVNNIDSYCSSK